MLQLSGDIPPPDPAKPVPLTQTITVRALSTWHALGIGVVTGFAVALGSMLFEKASRKTGLSGRRR